MFLGSRRANSRRSRGEKSSVRLKGRDSSVNLYPQINDRKGEMLKAASYVFLFCSLFAIRGSLTVNYSQPDSVWQQLEVKHGSCPAANCGYATLMLMI